MSRPRRGTGGARRQPQGRNPGVQRASDFWRLPPDPEPVQEITPAADPTALLRSLGSPPLANRGDGTDRYLALVVERSSAVATALAAAAGILAPTESE